MSFKERQINLILKKTDGSESITLQGYRSEANVFYPSGIGAAALNLKIYGMSLKEMMAFTYFGTKQGQSSGTTIELYAGNAGERLVLLFDGPITRAYPCFEAPEAYLIIKASNHYVVGSQGIDATPSSVPNGMDVAARMKNLADRIGYDFENVANSVQIQLHDQYLHGSVIEQIKQLATAAAIPYTIANNKVTIWANTGTNDGTVIEIGPDRGMVGYPTFGDSGLNIKCEFNPNLIHGRQIQLTSQLTIASGTFTISTVRHELSTYTSDGSWFTTVQTSAFPLLTAN